VIETIITALCIWFALAALMLCCYGLEAVLKRRSMPWQERDRRMSADSRALLARLEADPTIRGSKAWLAANPPPPPWWRTLLSRRRSNYRSSANPPHGRYP
jgi:hypothetical protein